MIKENPEEETTTEEEIKRFALQNAPPWAVSTAVHMILIVLLAIWTFAPRFNPDAVNIVATYSDELGDQLDDPFLQTDTQQDVQDPVLIEQMLPVVEDPFSSPPEVDISPVGNVATSTVNAPVIGSLFAGRDIGMQQRLRDKYGGNQKTDDAVAMGLDWLAKQQRRDGSWSMREPYPDGSTYENVEAATAMAMLAFQGAGHTHRNNSKHSKVVEKGMQYLLRVQNGQGDFFRADRKDEWLYTQAQCTIAICELLGMSGDPKLREPAERAVRFCIEAQDIDDIKGGGWRYAPRRDSDTSVTGWMAMAMQSAKGARIKVPDEVFERLSLYLDRASRVLDAEPGQPVRNDPFDDGARYGYMVGSFPTPVMTAEGALCRQYLGWDHYDARLVRGAEYVLDNPPTPETRDVYYWYYATQFLFHMEGDYWKRWNDQLRDYLVASQTTSGAQRGSWEPMGKNPDYWCELGHGGRLYVTCLSIYMLEVYYRHLPIYSDLKKQIEASQPPL